MDINQCGGMIPLIPIIYGFIISTTVTIILFILYLFVDRKLPYLIGAIISSIISIGSAIYLFSFHRNLINN